MRVTPDNTHVCVMMPPLSTLLRTTKVELFIFRKVLTA